MIDFEKIVAAAMADGYSEEEFAKQLTTALNKNKNKSKEEPKPTPEEEYTRKVKERADRAVKGGGQILLSEAIDILASCVFTLNPEWNLFCLDYFMQDLTKHVEISMEIISRINKLKTANPNPKDIADAYAVTFIETLFGVGDDKEEESPKENKSKETAGAPSHRSDDEILTSFFKSLGL